MTDITDMADSCRTDVVEATSPYLELNTARDVDAIKYCGSQGKKTEIPPCRSWRFVTRASCLRF
jgi:hypothetical protein